MTVRPAVLAGRWYPATAQACERFFSEIPKPDGAADAPKAAIVPHAGWVYSGAVAFGAMRALAEATPNPDLVIVFGGHLGPRSEPRLLLEGEFETPFGAAPVPEALAQDVAMAVACDLETPEGYYDDNAVEVQMPMVRHLWPEAPVLTFGVPPNDSAPQLGAEVLRLARQRGYEDVVIVGSTDLTHYGPNYDFQPHGRGFAGLEWVKTDNDPRVIEAMADMNAERVLWTAKRDQNACCAGAVAASIAAAGILGAKRGLQTAYTTSWDVRADGAAPTSFVGYVGMLLAR